MGIDDVVRLGVQSNTADTGNSHWDILVASMISKLASRMRGESLKVKSPGKAARCPSLRGRISSISRLNWAERQRELPGRGTMRQVQTVGEVNAGTAIAKRPLAEERDQRTA